MKWLILFVALTLFSCRKQLPVLPVLQINVDSLLDYHIRNLRSGDYSLEKVSRVGNHKATTSTHSKEINWSNELEAFRLISLINKPIYSDRYEVREAPDEKSNLTIKSWTAKEPLPITSLKVFFLKQPYQIKRMEAVIEQSNFVFSSSKELSLDFHVLGTRPTPGGYKISGQQKFFWEAPQYYSLEAIVHPK